MFFTLLLLWPKIGQITNHTFLKVVHAGNAQVPEIIKKEAFKLLGQINQGRVAGLRSWP